VTTGELIQITKLLTEEKKISQLVLIKFFLKL